MNEKENSFKKGFMNIIHKSFALTDSESYLQKNINIIRFLFGLVIAHQFFDMAGFAIIYKNPEYLYNDAIFAGVLGLCVALGFLTPVAILILLIKYFMYPQYAFNLGFMVAIIICWGFLFLGAGQRYSIDSWLDSKLDKHSFIKYLYFFKLDLNSMNIAYIRALLIFLYWGNCVSAIAFHFLDPMWLKGDVLQVFFVSSYISDHATLFENFRNNFPILYDFLCRWALYIQIFWEMVVFPFMFFRIGRAFVFLQGIVFFVSCLIFINLGYLPLKEIMLWTLLFNYPSFYKTSFGMIHGQDLNPKQDLKTPKWFLILCLIMLVSSVSFHYANIYSILTGHRISGIFWNKKQLPHFFMRLAGQDKVNVFNKQDLSVNSANLVIYEVREDGSKRKVPYFDEDASRLDYLRNDLLYFQYAGKWQRFPDHIKYLNSDFTKPNKATYWIISKVLILDACINKIKRNEIRNYLVESYNRDLLQENNMYVWGKTRLSFTLKYKISGDTLLDSFGTYCHKAYDLPPGH